MGTKYINDIDNIYRLPRVWSNDELKQFAGLFEGDVINVSGWKDQDKEGSYYKDYFKNCSSYSISNYKSEARGFQGGKDEIFLDLTGDLSEELHEKFDVVFNHTVLEHVYEVQKAFSNLCLLSKDIVIVVVPFLQEMHADYGDFWRFTPLTMKRMFEDNNYHLQYCSFNSHPNTSVYLFCIGVRDPSKWENQIPFKFSYEDPIPCSNRHSSSWVGCHALRNTERKSFLKVLGKKILNAFTR